MVDTTNLKFVSFNWSIGSSPIVDSFISMFIRLHQLLILIPEMYFLRSLLILLLYALYNKLINIKICNLIGIEIVIITLFLIWNNCIYSYRDYYIFDEISLYSITILCICRIIFLLNIRSLLLEDLRYSYEYIILILTSLLGMILLIKANDLIRMYLAIELQSMGMYILASYSRTKFRSEGRLKYYVMGGLTSCIQLLGIALIYGILGTTNYIDIRNLLKIGDYSNETLILPFILILSGLIFKLGGVPFHMWLPDVYQGSPLISTAFFSILPKLPLLIRIFRIINFINFDDFLISNISSFFYIITFLSILIGTLQALNQSNIKRLFAYSAISHIGFILIPFTIILINGSISIFYLMRYILMSIRLFIFLMEFKISISSNFSYFELNSLQLLNFFQPLFTFSFTLILFSIAGIPPLIGFFSKFYLLESALYNNNFFLRFIRIFGSIIATIYYIQIIQLLYFNNLGKIINQLGNILTRKISYINSIIFSFFIFIIILFISLNPTLFLLIIGQFF